MMNRILILIALVFSLITVNAQITRFGRDTNDTFYVVGMSYNNNASNILTGLNTYGTVRLVYRLLPVDLDRALLVDTNGLGIYSTNYTQPLIIKNPVTITNLTTGSIVGSNIYLTNLLGVQTIWTTNLSFRTLTTNALLILNTNKYVASLTTSNLINWLNAETNIVITNISATGNGNLSVDSNGVVSFASTTNLDITFQRGGSNIVVLNTNRTTLFQPLHFANSASESTSYGSELLSNTGFELLSINNFATNWDQSVNFGGIEISSNAHAGTNSALITSIAINTLSFAGSNYFNGATNTKTGADVYEYAMEAWVYPTQWPATKGIILSKVYPLGYHEDGYRAPSINELYLNSSGNPVLRMKAFYDHAFTCETALVLNQWTHIAVSCTNNVGFSTLLATWYFDGKPVSTNSVDIDSLYDLAAGWSVGYSSYYTNYGFSGMLSDVRVWRSSRSHSQVLTNYTQRLTGSESGLLNYWPLDEGSGTLLDDKVAGRVDGSFAAAPNAPSWASLQNYLSSDSVLVAANTNLSIQFYSYGDGVSPGSYGVYEPLLDQWLLSVRPIASSALAWHLTADSFATPANAQMARVIFYGSSSGGTLFDDVSLRNTVLQTNIWALAANYLARIGDNIYYGGKLLLQSYHLGINTTNWTNFDGGMVGGSLSNVTIHGGALTNATLSTSNLFLLSTTNSGVAYYDPTNGFQSSMTPVGYVTNSPYKFISSILYANNAVITNDLSASNIVVTNVIANAVNATNIFGTNVVGSVGQFTNYVQAYSVYFTNATGTTLGVSTVNATDLNASTVDATASVQAPTGTFTNLGSTTITGTTVNSATVNATTFNGTNGYFGGLYPLLSSNAPGTSYELSYIDGAGISKTTNLWWGLPYKWLNYSAYIGAQSGTYATNSSNIVLGSGAMKYGTNGVKNIVLGNQAGNYLSGSRNVVIGENAASSQTIYGLQNNGAANLASSSSYVNESYGGNINDGTFELWMQTTNTWDGDAIYSVAEIASSTTNYVVFGLGKVSGIGKMTFSAWNVTASAVVTLTSTINLPEPNTWNHFMWTWYRLGVQSEDSVDIMVVRFATNGVESANVEYGGFGSRANNTTTFSLNSVVRKTAQIRHWNTPVYGMEPFNAFGITNLIRTYLDKDSYIGVTPMSNFLIHSYPIIYSNATQVVDYGTKGNALDTTNTFLRVTDLPYPIIDPSSVYNDVSSGYIGEGASKTGSVALTNAWAVGKNASVSENNLLSLGSTTDPMNLKISGLTASQIVMTDANKKLVSTNVTLNQTNFEYLSSSSARLTNLYVTNVYASNIITTFIQSDNYKTKDGWFGSTETLILPGVTAYFDNGLCRLVVGSFTSGPTTNITIWSNDGTNAASKIVLQYYMGILMGVSN